MYCLHNCVVYYLSKTLDREAGLNTLRTDDANLPFNTRLVFTHLITQYLEHFLIWSSGPYLKKNVTLL
jgi:hypothetical protein